MTICSGTELGPYEILAPIGAGGMGEVYRARDTKLDRDVAVKVLPDTFARDPERVARRRDLLSGLPPNAESRSGYHECRKYLVTVGFADVDEMDLFKQVYAVASRKGSHPGVTDEVWGRLVCHLCWTTGYFLLNRYAVWKSHRRRWPADPGVSGAGNDGVMPGSWRWLQGVARRIIKGRRART